MQLVRPAAAAAAAAAAALLLYEYNGCKFCVYF